MSWDRIVCGVAKGPMRTIVQTNAGMKRCRLRILFLTNRVPFPISDGQSRRTYHVLRGLSYEHEVHLLSLHARSGENVSAAVAHLERFCGSVRLIEAPCKALSWEMVGRLIRSLVSKEPYTVWRHFSAEFVRAVRDAVAQHAIDIVHCDILPMAYAIRDLGELPCTLTDHDVCYIKAKRIGEHASNLLVKGMYWFESVKLRRFEKDCFGRVSVGVAVSEVDRDMLEALTNRQDLEVVANGVDTDEFVPSPDKEQPATILWVGGLDYLPNRDAVQWFLTDVFPIVKKRVPNAKCDVVGGGGKQTLRNFASDDSIMFHGFVESPVPYLQSATVFVVPVRSGSGTRLKMLEAMASGKAIVSTSIGAEGIKGDSGVHFLIADDPEEFAEQVVRLIRSAEERRRLGENARNLVVSVYDWRPIVAGLERRYRDLAAAKQWTETG